MRYKIMSRASCERYCTQSHSEKSIIISIKSSWDREKPHLYSDNNNNIIAILSLSFDDVDMEEYPEYAMQDDDGKQVAKFIERYYNNVDTIIAHCDGGISRSAGVIAGIMRVKEGHDHEVFRSKSKYPNITCFLRTLKGFGYKY